MKSDSQSAKLLRRAASVKRLAAARALDFGGADDVPHFAQTLPIGLDFYGHHDEAAEIRRLHDDWLARRRG